MDRTARPWQLALGHARLAVRTRVSTDDAVSGYCDGLSTWHDGECQRSLSTRLCAHTGSTIQWPPQHAFSSGSLASGAACSRTSSSSGQIWNPTSAASTRPDAGGQQRWDATAHHIQCDGSRCQANTWLSLWHGVVMSGRLIGGNLVGVAMWAEQRRGIGGRGS
jgi:hypothetical protein